MKPNWLSPSLFSTFIERYHYYDLVRPCTEYRYSPCRFAACTFPNSFSAQVPCSDRTPESDSCYLCTVCHLASTRLLLLSSVPGQVGCPRFWQNITRYRCFIEVVHLFNSLILTWRILFAFCPDAQYHYLSTEAPQDGLQGMSVIPYGGPATIILTACKA